MRGTLLRLRSGRRNLSQSLLTIRSDDGLARSKLFGYLVGFAGEAEKKSCIRVRKSDARGSITAAGAGGSVGHATAGARGADVQPTAAGSSKSGNALFIFRLELVLIFTIYPRHLLR